MLSISTTDVDIFVNVTKANFYSPDVYAGDFIVDSGNPGPDNELVITLPGATQACAMDFGGLFTGGAATITLSNGYIYSQGASPTVGQVTRKRHPPRGRGVPGERPVRLPLSARVLPIPRHPFAPGVWPSISPAPRLWYAITRRT